MSKKKLRGGTKNSEVYILNLEINNIKIYNI